MKTDNQAPSDLNKENTFQQLQSAINNTPIARLTKGVKNELNLTPLMETVTLHDTVDELKMLASLGDQIALKQLVYLSSSITKWLTELSSAGKKTLDTGNSARETQTPESHDCGSFEETITGMLHLPEARLKEIQNEVTQETPPSKFCYVETKNKIVDDICDRLIQRRINESIGEKVIYLASYSEAWPVIYPANNSWKHNWVDGYIATLSLGSNLSINTKHKAGLSKDHDSTIFNWYTFAYPLLSEIDAVRTYDKMSQHRIEWWRKAEANSEGYHVDPRTNQIVYAPRNTIFSSNYPRSIWNISNVWQRKAKFLPKYTPESQSLWLEALMARIATDCSGEFLEYPWPEETIARANSKGVTIETVVREKLIPQLKKILKAD